MGANPQPGNVRRTDISGLSGRQMAEKITIVRAPATTPDHDTPQADGYCSAGRAASKPSWSRRRVSNRPTTERPGAASDRVTRRRRRHADGQTERPARPQAGRIPSCSSTPPAPRTAEAPRTPGSVTTTLQRGVISILRLHRSTAKSATWGSIRYRPPPLVIRPAAGPTGAWRSRCSQGGPHLR